jgi:hypothetical protein
VCAAVAALVWVAGAAPAGVWAADLEPRTSMAYDEYLARARQAFLSRVANDGPSLPNERTPEGRPARDDGIIDVPGGLVHHWIGTALLRGVTLREVLDTSQSYAEYSTFHESIIASRVLARDGDTYRVLMRLREGGAGITAVLDIRSAVRYVHPSARSAYVLSTSEEVREVQNAGESGERLLPAGRDSGYLWRADTFTRFVQLEGGVHVEMETLGLSRRFPPLLGWIIEPIARRLGRKSVETSLREFAEAVQTRRSRRAAQAADSPR